MAVKNCLEKGQGGSLPLCLWTEAAEQVDPQLRTTTSPTWIPVALHIPAASISWSYSSTPLCLNLPLTLFLVVGGFPLLFVKPLGHL